ncbi:disintegrin and metalloproteinase domain-containing protein 9 [Chanos chanos]|uniref:Disintegrin and metalloproteinase domain-containing protein 9 n=1 Tax=Chanos chanos TaxID=29144 RepID=A0A6J2VGC9_CHACN|nr:disintegrin and metalloproteinase domain-containing protein 9-like [Chanos chanos]
MDPYQTLELKNYKVVNPQLVQERWKRESSSSHNYKEEENSEHLTYSIAIDGREHFLHLKRNKDFLAKNFVVVSHAANGTSVKKHSKGHRHCYYYGHVEGYEDSLVALSTCQGLRGVIFIGNEGYGLEPALNRSSANEHLLFSLRENQPVPFVCGLADDSSHDDDHSAHDPALSLRSFLRRKRNLPQTRYVELVLVVDKQRYDFKQGNETAVREEMVELVHLLDSYYRQLNIRVALVGLNIFQEGNPFSVEGAPGEVLGNFVRWRRSELLPVIRHDVGQLIVGRSGAYSGGVLGMAFVGTVCSAHNSGGINVFSNNNLAAFSTVLAHELGHNLGMNHDNSRCSCDGGCIMGASATGATQFSTCSESDFEKLILRGGGVCLLNQPSQDDVVTVAECGNGLLEKGEECDCGTPEECNNKCCNAATCTLTAGSACATGSCCKDCQFQVSGTPCRRSVNQCDLPEFCDGNSATCPADFYLMDGLPCAGNTAYCYEGRCQLFSYQCEQLFGSGAIKADDKCFRHVNTRGDRFGNCGYTGSRYTPCTVANSLCGKIQCTNFDANAPPAGAVISIENIEDGISCRNADFNLGPDVQDPGYVNTGTVCAAGKVCVDFQCVNASALETDLGCDAQTTCNSNGVCNDQGHCHCNDGWGPPNCNRGGRGGSVDSGPAQIDYSLRNGLLIFFLLVLPLLVLLIFAVLYVFKRDALTGCLRASRSRQYRSRNKSSGNTQRTTSPPPPTQVPPVNPQPFPPYPAAASSINTSTSYDNYLNYQAPS